MDYLPGQYGMHYERIGLNDYHFDSLGLAGHRPYYAFAGNQLATGEQDSNGNYYWMQQQHSGQHLIGQKQYELSNHLGNVQVTVSDLPYKHGDDTMTHISPALKAVYDYYPFGSPMPGRTIMDTARKCVDMTRLDRVWKAWEMTMMEIYALSLINYHLDGEGEVFIDDNGAVEVETADEHAVFYMDLQDSLNNGGEMVLHVDWLEELGEKGFQLYVQGLDATGEMRVFYQKHYKNPEDAVYLSIADSFTNISVGIQGALHFRIDNISYVGGSWVNEEVLVRVCDDGGDRYRFGFNGMLKDNEWAGMGTHLDFGARIYDSRSGRWLSPDPLMNQNATWSPYVFGLNNSIVFVDENGEWPGVTFFFFEFEIGAGLGYGLNYVEQSGIAYDEVGKTKFIMSNAIYIANQNLEEGSRDPNLVVGASISLTASIKQNWSAETFSGLITQGGSNYPVPVGKGAAGLAANIGFSKNEFSIGLGVGAGLKISHLNSRIRESISLTDAEASKVSKLTDVWTNSWIVNKIDYNKETKLWEGTVATKNKKGELIDTGIQISSDNITNSDGSNTPSGIWMSKSYRAEAAKAEKK